MNSTTMCCCKPPVKNILDTRYEYKLGDGTYGRTLDFRISLRY